MEVRFRIPRLPAGALSNLVGLLGLVAIALAVGALAGSWWWSVLAGGVAAVGLCALAQAQDAAATRPVKVAPAVAKVRPRTVAEDAAA